jgi:glucose/arabinose dehydrogenase
MSILRSTLLLLLCLGLAAAPERLVPDAPPITEPGFDGAIVNPADVHMVAGPFNDPAGNTHASTDWEVWKVSNNELIWTAPAVTDPILMVHIHLADGSFINSYTGRTTMEFATDYRLVVRFRNDLGQTSTDSIRLFSTSAAGPPGTSTPLPWVPFEAGYRVELVASGFQLPVNIAFVPTPGPNPTDPFFYVTELYGTIKVVQRDGSVGIYAKNLLNYDPTGGFPGSGENGLAGICVAPNGDVYATMLENVPGLGLFPKIVRMSSADGGLTGAITTTLHMPGHAQGPSHQISHCSINPTDGLLYVHSGDGFDPATCQDNSTWLGKVLRMNLDLTPAAGNPYLDATDGLTQANDYVFASGFRNPFGGAWRASNDTRYSVENGPSVDRLARVTSGRNFGHDGTDASMSIFAIYNWPQAHAPVNIAFIQPATFSGSGYPIAKMDHAFVSESGPTHAQGPQGAGKRIVEFQLDATDGLISGPTTFVEYVGTGYATVAGLTAGPDGLYFTDLYKDNAKPADPAYVKGGNVYRVRYMGALPVGTGTGFEGRYFTTRNLKGTSVVRTDPTIDFFWPAGTQPHPAVPDDNFSVRWRGLIEARTSDPYTFTTTTDDGVRLRVNGNLLIDKWIDQSATDYSGTISLVAGQKVLITMEYYDAGADAVAKLCWSGPSQPKEVVPQSQIYAPPPLKSPSGGGKGGCGAGSLDLLLLLALLGAIRRVRGA